MMIQFPGFRVRLVRLLGWVVWQKQED